MIFYVTRKTIYSAVLFFMVYVITFVRFEYFTYYNLMRYAFIALSALFILFNFRTVFKRKYLKINLLLLLFSAVVIFSSLLNKDIIKDRDPFLASIVFCAVINIVLYTAEFAIETDHVRLMIGVFFTLCLFINFITDILLLAVPELFTSHSRVYFIGNKFPVVYAHYLMTVLYLCRRSPLRNVVLKMFFGFLMLAWTMAVSIIVNCATGIVGCFILGFVLMLPIRGRSLCSNKVFIIASAIVMVFPLAYQLFISIPFVQSIIFALGHDLTMTGRQGIFVFVMAYILKSKFFGFGFGTSYELGMSVGGFPDTQNCYLEWVWQSGIIGLACLIIFLTALISTIKKYNKNMNSVPFKSVFSLFLTFLLLGTVEITIFELFFGVAAITLAVGTANSSDSNQQSGINDPQPEICELGDQDKRGWTSLGL